MPRFVTPDEADELRESGAPADRIIVVGQTADERDLCIELGRILHIDPSKLTARIIGPEAA